MKNTLKKISDFGIKVNEELLADKIAAYQIKAETEKGQSSMRRAKILQNLQTATIEGRIHSNYRVTDTSGRIQSFEPCLSNVPKDDRDIFDIGTKLDYAQCQLRIAAFKSNETKLLDAFEMGQDPYQFLAEDINCTRNEAKVIALGPLFGMGSKGIAARLRIKSTRAQTILNRYKAKYPKLFKWVAAKMAEFSGNETLETPWLKVKLTIPIKKTAKKYKDADPQFIEHMHQASMVAAYLQGAESDMLKLTLKKCEAECIQVVNMIHDEIYLDVSMTEAQVARTKEIMETVIEEMIGITRV